MLFISRAHEESCLANPDGTCSMKSNCVRIVVFNQHTYGKAVFESGPCVLCCRVCATSSQTQPYTNLSGEYPEENLILPTGRKMPLGEIYQPFVKWNVNDYSTDGKIQYFAKLSTWIFDVYDLHGLKKFKDPHECSWKLAFCDKEKVVLNAIDDQYSCGFVNTYFSVESNSVHCSTCTGNVLNIEAASEYTPIQFNNKWYCKCYQCGTVTHYECNTIFLCEQCKDLIFQYRTKSTRQCYYCFVFINKKNCFSYELENKQVVFLCNKHRLSRGVLRRYLYNTKLSEKSFRELLGLT